MVAKELVDLWNDGDERVIIIYESPNPEEVLFENTEKVFLKSPFCKRAVKEWLVYHHNDEAVLEMGV